MIKNYNITVNGNTYQVEVEEVSGQASPSPRSSATPTHNPSHIQVPKADSISKPAPTPAPVGGGGNLTSPMPGTINDVRVSSGDRVTKGQVLVILEAMKMENEICAAVDATVASVSVNKGASVNAGDVLITFA